MTYSTALTSASATSTAIAASALASSEEAEFNSACAADKASRHKEASKQSTAWASSARTWTDESSLTVTDPLETKNFFDVPSAS